jgi:O-antigen ligase
VPACRFTSVLHASGKHHYEHLTLLSVLLFAYFFLNLAGMLWTSSENFQFGFSIVEKNKPFLLLPVFFIDQNFHQAARRKILNALIVACTVAAAYCTIVNIRISINEYNTLFHEWRFSHDRFSEPIGITAVYFAFLISLCLLSLTVGLCKKKFTLSKAKAFGTFVLMALLFLALIATSARTITLTVVVILSLLMIQFAIRQKKTWLLGVAAVIPIVFAGLILMNPVAKTRFLDLFNKSYENSNYGSYFARLNIWIPGVDVIQENVVVGVGTGDLKTELNKKYAIGGFAEGIDKYNMHNQYLETLCNFGLVGLILLLSVFFVHFRKAFRSGDHLYQTFMLLFFFACITESFLSRNKGIMFFLSFSFVFFNSRWESDRNTDASTADAKHSV